MQVPSIAAITVRRDPSTWHHTLDPGTRSYKTREAAATALVQAAQVLLASAKDELRRAHEHPCDSGDYFLTAFDDVAIPPDCPISALPNSYRSPAIAFASIGGKSKSEAKRAAARGNGRKGGRPRKSKE